MNEAQVVPVAAEVPLDKAVVPAVVPAAVQALEVPVVPAVRHLFKLEVIFTGCDDVTVRETSQRLSAAVASVALPVGAVAAVKVQEIFATKPPRPLAV